MVYGGNDLINELVAHDLVDEHRILLHPVLLGAGRTSLRSGTGPLNLTLVSTTVLSGGVAVLTYQRAR